MIPDDVLKIALGALQGLASSTVFVLVLFIGFCVVFGFLKTKATAGGNAKVVKSLDERISHQPFASRPSQLPWTSVSLGGIANQLQ